MLERAPYTSEENENKKRISRIEEHVIRTAMHALGGLHRPLTNHPLFKVLINEEFKMPEWVVEYGESPNKKTTVGLELGWGAPNAVWGVDSRGYRNPEAIITALGNALSSIYGENNFTVALHESIFPIENRLTECDPLDWLSLIKYPSRYKNDEAYREKALHLKKHHLLKLFRKSETGTVISASHSFDAKITIDMLTKLFKGRNHWEHDDELRNYIESGKLILVLLGPALDGVPYGIPILKKLGPETEPSVLLDVLKTAYASFIERIEGDGLSGIPEINAADLLHLERMDENLIEIHELNPQLHEGPLGGLGIFGHMSVLTYERTGKRLEAFLEKALAEETAVKGA